MEKTEYFEKMEKSEVFQNAIADALQFVHEWEYFEGDQAIKDAAFYALPTIVKVALDYLVYTGEID